MAVGLATVCVPMYISEFSPDRSRGFYGTLHQLLITIGILVATLLGLAFGSPPTDTDFDYQVTTFQQCWWRFMLAFPAGVSIIAILLLWLVYTTESPHFLMHQGRKNTAVALLKELLGKEDVSNEIQTIEVAICQQKVLEAESLSFQQFTGINILVANSNKLYTSLNIDASLVTALTVVMGFVNVLMTVPAIFLMDRLGRRTLLLAGCFGQAASTIVALIANLVDRNNTAVQWLTVACIYLFVISFAVGYGPVLWVYLHEIFPPEIKQTGASVASAINAIATIIVVLPSDFVLTSDMRVMLGICGGTSLIAFIVSLIFMKETAGLSIDESPYFKGKRRVMSKYFDVTGLNNPGQQVPSLASGHFSATQLAPAPSGHGKELSA
ncbi:LOW QUALITY PROTEIN: facilitative glucose transporter, putative [Eimeria mitis]|uniref:Hexose transporter 1 n=1 Tax=Eimeria mitis TaxID=44415 RepID=U6JZ69_9EIME|nr:LOW QUALITY PROTEIN: facilitative glucose transporter, putative [Eimeria mitis]CDJ30785.1 facilitative glucose transporter, putative [Eimeria mitis]